jgi:hypothetical protein
VRATAAVATAALLAMPLVLPLVMAGVPEADTVVEWFLNRASL